MNYVERYIEQFLRATVRNNIKHYLLTLDEKMKNLDDYMRYLITKKEQLSKLIDSLMLTLENKYIDIAEAFQIQCAREINNQEIENIKSELNKVEAYYAQIETQIQQTSTEKNSNRKNIVSNKLYERCGIERRRNMTHKYISTQMLIIFTALMIIANFYYIFFEKIGFLLVLLLGCVLVYVGYLYFHKIRGLLAFWIGALLIAFTLLSNKYTIIILFVFLLLLIVRYLIHKFKPKKVVATDEVMTSPSFIKQKWFGEQRTPVYVYKWEDVQIQHGIGDLHIDLTKAANIKENNTIVVRHILGKVQVILPVNYNINLHVAAFYGSTYVNEKSYKVENNNIHIEEMMKPDNYTVNIYVSTFIGDVEVIYR